MFRIDIFRKTSYYSLISFVYYASCVCTGSRFHSILQPPDGGPNMKICTCEHCRYTFRYPLIPLMCPDCGKKIELFGKSRAEEAAKQYGIENYITLPIMPELAGLSDQGLIEDMPETLTDEAMKLLQGL